MWFLQSHFFSLILIVPLPQFRNSVLKIESLLPASLQGTVFMCHVFCYGKIKTYNEKVN